MSVEHGIHPRSVVGPLAWACCLQFFVVEQIASHAWQPPYNFAENYISDLGAVRCTCSTKILLSQNLTIYSPLHAWMNGSFVLQGLLIFAGAILTTQFFPSCTLSGIARWVLSLAALGVVVVGLAPEDVHSHLHFAGAAAHLLLGNVGICLLGVASLRGKSQVWRPLATAGVALGSLGLLATFMLANRHHFRIGPGAMERASAYPIPISLSAIGLALLWKRFRKSNAAMRSIQR